MCHLNVSILGKIIQACCFPACNVSLDTDLAKEDIQVSEISMRLPIKCLEAKVIFLQTVCVYVWNYGMQSFHT